jgi:ribose transport system permease protein
VSDFRLWAKQSSGMLIALGLLTVMFSLYLSKHDAGLTMPVLTTAINKGVLLALVAMAQTVPVLTRGIDLSVGMIFVMANCIASAVVVGTPGQVALGVILVLAVGIAAGALNGVIVVYGRLQPIITTVATGAVFHGVALSIRPVPGGDVSAGLADFFTQPLFDRVPGALLLLGAVVLLVWVPFARSVIGRGVYAVGSAEGAAYMSGVSVNRSKLAAYTLSGFLAATAGLFLTFMTYSGEASAAIGGAYTLNSIAAVVIGGTSLFGGAGGAIGSIFGAFVLRTIEDLLFIFDLPALWQPLFQGLVLLGAVTFGAARVFRIRNRLTLLG